MFPMPARLTRTVFAGVALVACADSNPPTQPAARVPTLPANAPAVAADVSVQATPTTIYACYTPGKGDMYRIKTADTPVACEKKDVEFSWVDQPTGAISGLTFASASVTLTGDGRYFASCPAGQSVMNFGYEIPVTSTATTSQILLNRPTLTGGRTLWVFRAAVGTGYVFYWTCVNAEPATSAP